MKKVVNEKPFELMGYCYQDYLNYCKYHGKKIDLQSKKEFFADIYAKRIYKENGEVKYEEK